jgi:hypothetical protein
LLCDVERGQVTTAVTTAVTAAVTAAATQQITAARAEWRRRSRMIYGIKMMKRVERWRKVEVRWRR